MRSILNFRALSNRVYGSSAERVIISEPFPHRLRRYYDLHTYVLVTRADRIMERRGNNEHGRMREKKKSALRMCYTVMQRRDASLTKFDYPPFGPRR